MTRSGGKVNIFLTLVIVAIIIISTFTVVIYFQVSELNAEAKEKESLPMSVSISADKTSGFLPIEVNFSSIITDYSGKLEYYWDFGDGATSEEMRPSHIYEENGTHVCELKVTDEKGKEGFDKITISPEVNRAPRASIDISSTNPDRKFKFTPSYLLLRSATKNNAGRNLYYLRNFGIAPKSEEKSTIHASALVSDPEGDEIVSYEWTLNAPIMMLFGGKQHYPKYTYYGENVTFDLLDTYVTGKYDLKLKVTDSAGNIDTEIISFQVQENPLESRTFGMYKYYKSTWLTQLSKFQPTYMIVVGAIAYILYNNGISEQMSLPLVKLCIMLFLSYALALSPEAYGDETLIDVGEEFFDKWQGLKIPGKRLFDFIEAICTIIGMSETVEKLQIAEEDLDLDNKRPIISNPYPQQNAEFIDIGTSKIYITVKDPEGDPFNVRIYGEYINTSANHNVTYLNVENGTFTAPLITPLPRSGEELTYINWHVEVVEIESQKVVTTNYKFTTAYE